MRAAKATLRRAAEKLVERAEECFERAEDQHKVADLQHENAEHIAALGHALEADAAELFGEGELHAAPEIPSLKPRRPDPAVKDPLD